MCAPAKVRVSTCGVVTRIMYTKQLSLKEDQVKTGSE